VEKLFELVKSYDVVWYMFNTKCLIGVKLLKLIDLVLCSC